MTSQTATDVILPTHNRPHTIAYAIEAVLRQTHSALTLHVIGDGCGDDTEEVVRGFRDPRVSFHRFPKGRGYGYAHRNTVLRSLRGDTVAYASDDDLWFPDHLEHGLAALDAGLDAVASRSIHVRGSGELDQYLFAFDWRVPGVSAFLRNWFLGALTIVHRRSVFDRIGYWDENLVRFGDRDLYARARSSSLATAYRDRATVLRFYAQDWDERYPGLDEPPQRSFLAKMADRRWCDSVQNAAADRRRSMAIRRRQWNDFARFARRSGLKFVRYWFQRGGVHGN